MKNIKGSVLTLGGFAIFILLLAGCVTVPTPTTPYVQSYSINVDSIADTGANLGDKTYIISSAMKGVSDNDLQFKEFARYVENALSQKGYKRVGSERARA
ncbi:MAG: hypothetical protein QM482_00390 [Sulfurospirillum sp.]